jgi:hypothetical protein
MKRIIILVSVILATGYVVGCSGNEGPNDPTLTHNQIQKIRDAAVKPTDGKGPATPGANPGTHKR